MDALSMFKFWKTNKTKIAVDAEFDGDTVTGSVSSDPLTVFSDDDDDDDDSFFELELTLPKFNTNNSSSSSSSSVTRIDKFEPKMSSKPQSPISILRSASPKLRIFMFGKKSKNVHDFVENDGVSSSFSPKSNDSTPFTVKFKIEDGSIVPKFTRTNSSNQLLSPNIERRSSDDSKRFSKDVVQKYLNFVKPLYSKKSNEGGEKFTVSCSPTRTSSSSSASFSSPMKESRFKAKTKQLGKSKSASAMIVSAPSSARNDHPCDGIEGAILHCKRSLNSATRGQSALSRCSSDPSHEKSITMSEESKEK